MNMDGWDLLLLLVAGYFSVVLLVRLMRAQRDRLVGDMRRQIQREQIRLASKRSTSQASSTGDETNDTDSQAA